MGFILRLLITAIVFYFLPYFIPGIHVANATAAIVAALIFGLVNAIVRPIVLLLTLPATILTLGLFIIVVNALMFWLTAYIAPGFKVDGFGPALWGAIVMMIVGFVVSHLFRDERRPAPTA